PIAPFTKAANKATPARTINLNGIPAVWKREFPILLGMLPGIASRGLCPCFASTRLGQIRYLHDYSTPHPGPSSRLAEAHSVDMPDRPPFWNGFGHPLFGNDHLRASLSNSVQ